MEMNTESVLIGFQAGINPYTSQENIVIMGYPGAPTSGGFNAVEFPDGGYLRGWDWESAVKVEGGEVLFILKMGISGLQNRDKDLLATVHEPNSFRIFGIPIGYTKPVITRQIILANPIVIPHSGVIWVYAEGWSGGKARPAGVEVQTALLIESHTDLNWKYVSIRGPNKPLQ